MVSVIVPNYNHYRFLSQRIESILNQSFQKFELILLDDCSSDGSWELMKSYSTHPKVSHCLRNEINSGNTFKQWRRGIELANGEFIWIAESDDWAEPDFLERCVSLLQTEDLALVLTGSKYIDAENRFLGEVAKEFPSGIRDGNQFCQDHMYFRNSILNASAVVFSRSKVQPKMLESISGFKLSGDHFFWVQLIKDQRIGIIEEKLNHFRWHDKSVRAAEANKLTELLEGIRIKNWMEENYKIASLDKSKPRRNAYLTYFKFLKKGIIEKDQAEFKTLVQFFNPLDKFKSFIRFLFT